MGKVQNRAARGFVNAASFHSDKTIFDKINPTDAVFAAEFVQRLHDFEWRHFGGRNSCDAGTASPARTGPAGTRPPSCNPRASSHPQMKAHIIGPLTARPGQPGHPH